jgi:hypothetical protein
MALDGDGLRALIDVARRSESQTFEVDGRTFVLRPRDLVLDEVQRLTPRLPERINQTLRFDTKDSFIEYINAFADQAPHARIFADVNRDLFVGVLDYHEPARESGVVGACGHRCEFKLLQSEQWQRWSKISGTLMGQADFVRFLEENCADVSAPSSAELMEICRDFSAARKVDFREAVRLESGARRFEYSEEIRGGARDGEIEVPSKFTLNIPIYYGALSTEVHAFLRYQINGSLLLGVELHRPKFIQQAVFEAIGADIAERTYRPVHDGALI